DKAIFFFWSFGISKTSKRSLFIICFYGFGLLTSNLLISTMGIIISHSPRLFIPDFTFDAYQLSFYGALTSLIAAGILFLVILYSSYTQKIHSKFNDVIARLNWEKNRTPFLFGILVGLAPCVFEIFVYAKVLEFSFLHDPLWGLVYMFYFWLGTFIGLFFIGLAEMGTSQFFHPNKKQKKTIFILMIMIIVAFNIVVIIASLLKINIYPNP
ncbi:MAG: sulfite exporter TauE/SafE family protein, partial [Promethearchaeota archaeon]